MNNLTNSSNFKKEKEDFCFLAPQKKWHISENGEDTLTCGISRSTSSLTEKVTRSSNVTFEGSIMTNNIAHQHGGVLSTRNSVTTIAECTVVNNSASQDGGVYYVEYSSFSIIQNSLYEYSSCSWEEGVIITYRKSTAGILNSKLSEWSGGKIFMEHDCDNVSKTNEFINNKAALKGGCAYIADHSSFKDGKIRLRVGKLLNVL